MEPKNKKKVEEIIYKNKVFTDGERSTRWGIENIELESLADAGIPFCYNPNTQKAVLLFDGRRRITSVAKVFGNHYYACLTPIRSKAFSKTFLENDSDQIDKDTESSEKKKSIEPNIYGFGLTEKRLNGESFPAVEIARIISELNLTSLRALHDYIMNERPDLLPELTQHHVYYSKILNKFETVDRLKEINETLKNGFKLN